MVDITPKIKDAIRRAHANSWYAYPADWSSFPVCAFYLAGHGDYARADGREYLARVAYQVDVWAGTPEDVAQVSGRIDAELTGMGMQRESAMDLYEPDPTLYRRTMTYAAAVTPDGVIYEL